MAYNLIYIDDEIGKRDAFADSLTDNSDLEIKSYSPSNLGETRDLIFSNQELDGVILDLKLDGVKYEENTADYTAPSLATAIRSKIVENNFKNEFPIFLLTSQDNLEKYYKYDLTSHDLFDFLFFKQKLGEVNNYPQKIISILDAYKTIKEEGKKMNSILKVDLSGLINVNLPSKFYDSDSASVYDISKFVLKKIVLRQGILISEEVLAARLGVDIEASQDWEQLKVFFKHIKYDGIYSQVWNRWWSHKLVSYWREVFPKSPPLISLNATERVEIIKKQYNLPELKPATPIEKASGSKFWTVCKVYNKPLDVRDGILIEMLDSEPWHDKMYISLESILERDYKGKKISIHPSEIDRVNDLKEGY
ncbi:hypothetical protein BXY80_2187 [Ichthyenterobacterium magnum]|uniref:Uncharacterized protein n=2 Tax=Ichthyenterobacterium magnum TaxID=1230530 RepID=A0A420DGR7_9FLAO|nr:hypothetical protein BXY80_2187 [Ichthyenterobacterium magnum]